MLRVPTLVIVFPLLLALLLLLLLTLCPSVVTSAVMAATTATILDGIITESVRFSSSTRAAICH